MSLIRRTSGRPAKRLPGDNPLQPGLRGGSATEGYAFEVYIAADADAAATWVTESICRVTDDEECLATLGDLWLPVEDEDAPVLYIERLFVNPAWRGRGRARELLATLERWGRQRGAKSVLLHSAALWGGGPSGPFWEHMGFEELADVDGHLVMWKAL